jgi:hypothetical protein
MIEINEKRGFNSRLKIVVVIVKLEKKCKKLPTSPLSLMCRFELKIKLFQNHDL